MAKEKIKVCFLASGEGGHFKFIHLALRNNIIKNIELFLVADRVCGSGRYASDVGIPFKVVNYSRHNNKELDDVLSAADADFIITNWHKILDEKIVSKYRGKLINLHYSILPSFDGMIGIKPIEAAYERKCGYVGATCHFVDEGVDTGMIISQAIIKSNVKLDDAIQSVFQSACLILLNSLQILTSCDLIEKSKKDQFHYSPSLVFNDQLFDLEFWTRLKKL